MQPRNVCGIAVLHDVPGMRCGEVPEWHQRARVLVYPWRARSEHRENDCRGLPSRVICERPMQLGVYKV